MIGHALHYSLDPLLSAKGYCNDWQPKKKILLSSNHCTTSILMMALTCEVDNAVRFVGKKHTKVIACRNGIHSRYILHVSVKVYLDQLLATHSGTFNIRCELKHGNDQENAFKKSVSISSVKKQIHSSSLILLTTGCQGQAGCSGKACRENEHTKGSYWKFGEQACFRNAKYSNFVSTIWSNFSFISYYLLDFCFIFCYSFATLAWLCSVITCFCHYSSMHGNCKNS